MVYIDNTLPHDYSQLLSLDFYRGFTMFLLIAEGAGLWHAISVSYFDGSIIHFYSISSSPLKWVTLLGSGTTILQVYCWGCHAHLLRQTMGPGRFLGKTFKHALYQSFMLLLLGVMIQCAYAGSIFFQY